MKNSIILILATFFFLSLPAQENEYKQALENLSHKDPMIRRSAIETLYSLRKPEAIPHIRKALKDENPFVRMTAADTLGLMRSKEALPDLLTLIQKDTAPQVRQTAIVALGYIGDRSTPTLNVLIKSINDPDRGCSLAAINTLGILRVPETIPTLAKLLEKEDVIYRRAAIYALKMIDDPSSLPYIRKCLKDTDSTVRAESALMCGKFKDILSTATLRDLLKDTDSTVRISASYALALMNDNSGLSIAREIIKQEKDITRLTHSIETLSMVGVRSDISLLEPLLKHENTYIRTLAELAITRIKSRFPEPEKPKKLRKK